MLCDPAAFIVFRLVSKEKVLEDLSHKDFLISVLASSLTDRDHRTQAANEHVNNLACYTCDTMKDGNTCAEVIAGNKTLKSSIQTSKCESEELICMVKRFSYTTSTENSTSEQKLWSLKRTCTDNCEAGCIIIGERTKLYACTSCCRKSLCNTGRGAGDVMTKKPKTLLNFISFLYIFKLCVLL